MQSSDGYSAYAAFYDELHGDRAARIARVQAILDAHAPAARSVLELACGTGSILAGLRPRYEKAGLDGSAAMLRIARARLPGSLLVRADMAGFKLPRTFDAIFCTFNSLDHLPNLAAWARTFAAARAHLNRGGLFFFDTNTHGRLQALAAHHSWQTFFAGGVVASQVEALPHDVLSWRVKYSGAAYPEGEQTMLLRTYPPADIAAALERQFRIVDVQTMPGDPLQMEDAGRTYYICTTAPPHVN
jgi:SAM-dependent methyltransferase